MNELCCAVWPNNGDVWGVRIGKRNREVLRGRDRLVFELAGERHEFPLTATFWTTCPEVRGAAIRDWLHGQGVTHANRRGFVVMLRRHGDHWLPRVQRAVAEAADR